MIFDVAIAAFPNKPTAQVEQWLSLFQQSLPDQAEDSMAFFEYLLGQRLISPIEYEEAVSSSKLNVGGESLAVEFGGQYGWLEEDSFDESEDIWQHDSAQATEGR